MHVRLMKFIRKENILFVHQYGLQKKTTLAILDIYTKIVSSIENNDIACGIFLDLPKYLCINLCVNHSILLQKMEHYGIKGFTIVMVHLIPEQTPSSSKNKQQYV